MWSPVDRGPGWKCVDFNKRLDQIRQDFESGETPVEIIEVLNKHVDRLVASDVTKQAAQVGESVCLEQVVQTSTGPRILRDFLEDRFLVMTWFRGNW